MRPSLLTALVLLTSALPAIPADDEIPVATSEAVEPQPSPSIDPDEATVLCVTPRGNGGLNDADVEFQFADGQTVTARTGQPIDTRWWLEKVAWSDDEKGAVVTLRNGEDRRELRAGADRIVPAGGPRPPRAQVQIQSHWFEMPVQSGRRVRRALEATPGEDRTPFEILDRALEAGAPPQVLTPAQFDALNKFLAGSRDINRFNAPGVTTKSGQRAVIEIIREFRYPVEWAGAASGEKLPPPTAFETRNCGITLEIEPNVVHGPLLALDLTPQVVELLGAADRDKGTPIPYHNQARLFPDRATGPMGKMPFTVARPARYVFSGRKEKTRINVPPGSGVLLTNFREEEDIEPFQRTAPKGRLILLVKAEMLNP